MNGAAASEISRQASTRSPSTARSRAGFGVAGLHGLRQRPRLLGVDEPVRRPDELPQRRQRVVSRQPRASRDSGQVSVQAAARPAAGPPPAARRRSSGSPSRSSGSAGCRSRWPGRRCSGARTSPRRRPCRGRRRPRAGSRSARRRRRASRTTSIGSRKLPRLLLIRSPWASSQPWTQTWRGASSRRSRASPASRSCGTGRCPCR
jgi:hypothetical protein